MNTSISGQLPCRTEPLVLNPGMYTQHAQLDPQVLSMDEVINSKEACQELLKRKEKENKPLSPQETMGMIYHPDEQVLLSLIDFKPGTQKGWHRYIEPEFKGVKMGEIGKFLARFMGLGMGGRGEGRASQSWNRTRSETKSELQDKMWIRLWKRVIDSLESEGIFWSPLMDQFLENRTLWTRFQDTLVTKSVRRVQERVDQKLEELGQWIEEHGNPDNLQQLQNFQHPRLQRTILKYTSSLTLEHAHHIVQHTEQHDLIRVVNNSNIQAKGLQNLFQTIHQQQALSKFHRKQMYREIANHPNANAESHLYLMGELFSIDTDERREYTEDFNAGDALQLWKADGWLEEATVREHYFRTAPRGEIASLVAAHMTEPDCFLPELIAAYPTWIGQKLIKKRDSFVKVFHRWVQENPTTDLTPLLRAAQPEARREAIRLIAQQETEQNNPAANTPRKAQKDNTGAVKRRR